MNMYYIVCIFDALHLNYSAYDDPFVV